MKRILIAIFLISSFLGCQKDNPEIPPCLDEKWDELFDTVKGTNSPVSLFSLKFRGDLVYSLSADIVEIITIYDEQCNVICTLSWTVDCDGDVWLDNISDEFLLREFLP